MLRECNLDVGHLTGWANGTLACFERIVESNRWWHDKASLVLRETGEYVARRHEVETRHL